MNLGPLLFLLSLMKTRDLPTPDAFEDFLAACCTLRPDIATRANRILAAYHKWAGDDCMSAKRLAGLLRGRGFSWYVSGGIWYIGIALTTELENSRSYPA
jgi:hypothetical protein